MAVVDIPDKPYFKIGEVAALAAVEPYVLRYWESEFSAIRPEKTRAGQRRYRRRDVELVLTIKQLLHDEGYRIDGAKRRLKELASKDAAPSSAATRQLVDGIRELLADLEKILDEDGRM